MPRNGRRGEGIDPEVCFYLLSFSLLVACSLEAKMEDEELEDLLKSLTSKKTF